MSREEIIRAAALEEAMVAFVRRQSQPHWGDEIAPVYRAVAEISIERAKLLRKMAEAM